MSEVDWRNGCWRAAPFIKDFQSFNYGIMGYKFCPQLQSIPPNQPLTLISLSLLHFPSIIQQERKVKQWLASLRRGKERKWSKDGGAEINKVD